GKRRAQIDATLALAGKIIDSRKRRRANAILLSDPDPEIATLAAEENASLARDEQEAENELMRKILPRDPDDEKDAIVEIRAGAGGDESGLFAADLFRMYARFAERKGWKMTLLSSHPTGIGGLKEVIAEIASGNTGEPIFETMKYESGVHRVQRIPSTEKTGRVHTSTATVAVLPRAEDVDISISPTDLRIDTYASSGPGGQSVNTTNSAVRITHIPTGTVVTCQDEKSQHKNKDRAMSVLRARLLKQAKEEQEKKQGKARLSQIGTGDRSEKIRTYNFPQDRVTDHRIKKNWSAIAEIMDGNLDEIIDALREEDTKAQLDKREG
ncbi:MAG: peptide chain release factor 1, partial [Alphaproteobacteria bacterium]